MLTTSDAVPGRNLEAPSPPARCSSRRAQPKASSQLAAGRSNCPRLTPFARQRVGVVATRFAQPIGVFVSKRMQRKEV